MWGKSVSLSVYLLPQCNSQSSSISHQSVAHRQGGRVSPPSGCSCSSSSWQIISMTGDGAKSLRHDIFPSLSLSFALSFALFAQCRVSCRLLHISSSISSCKLHVACCKLPVASCKSIRPTVSACPGQTYLAK